MLGGLILMAVSAPGSQCRWAGFKRSTRLLKPSSQAEKAPSSRCWKSVAPVASNYATPANVTEQPGICEQGRGFRKWGSICRESYRSIDYFREKEIPLPSDAGSRPSLTQALTLQLVVPTDVAVQPKSFVDVSSHNGDISIGDYRTLANKGVGGVVVKLTEDAVQ